jgi:hypothetical protein
LLSEHTIPSAAQSIPSTAQGRDQDIVSAEYDKTIVSQATASNTKLQEALMRIETLEAQLNHVSKQLADMQETLDILSS